MILKQRKTLVFILLKEVLINEFRRSSLKYGYDRQSAFYGDGFKAERFIFIVIEKSAPYNIGIYECSAEFIEEGREKYKNLLSQYKEYFIDKAKDPYEHIHEGLL